MTIEDKIRNLYLRGGIGVASILYKMRENILRYWYVKERNTEAVRLVMELHVDEMSGVEEDWK